MKFEGLKQYVEVPIKEKLKADNLVFVDEKFSEQDWEQIGLFNIEKNLPQFEYSGNDYESFLMRLEECVRSCGNNSEESIEVIVTKISTAVAGMLSAFKAEAVLVMVRVSLPNDSYNIPRWHTDGRYFTSEEKVYKKVFTLKGAATRFAKIKDSIEFDKLDKQSIENDKFNAVDSDKHKNEDLRIRKGLDTTVEEIRSAQPGESVIYLVGDKEAVIHSEPVMTEPRLFMSVIVGSKDQISEWKG